MSIYRAFYSAVLIFLSVAAAWAKTPMAIPVDGASFAADLAEVDDRWHCTFLVDGTSRRLPASNLVRWGTPVDVVRGPVVVFADGGLLVADVTETRQQTLRVDSPLFGPLDVSLDETAGIVFQLPGSETARDQLLDRVAGVKRRPARKAYGERSSDRVFLKNGDEVAGFVGQINLDAVTLDAEAGPLEIAIDAITAVAFNALPRTPPRRRDIRCWVGLRDGSLLLADGLISDGSILQLIMPGNQTWKTTGDELISLQPIGEHATYLSERRMDGYGHVPFLDLKWPRPGIDRNVMGGRLRCGKHLYLKGIGMHSTAMVSYALDGSYRHFQAELGVDDSTAGRGSVRFRVRVDQRQTYVSETIRGGMEPVPISIDVSGARRLDLIVDFADRADQLDRANWLDARLVR